MAQGRKRSVSRESRLGVGPPEDKRHAILRAAVKVFADRGYQGCRIADIAREARVAYGLVYHYFENKDELLESVFSEQWATFIQSVRAIAEGPGSPSEQVASICGFAVDEFKRSPEAVRVMILELARMPNALQTGGTRRTFESALAMVAGIVHRGQQQGEIRPGTDPMVAAAAILGALELCLSGMAMGLLSASVGDSEVDRVKRDLVNFVLGGLSARQAEAGEPTRAAQKMAVQ